jgi:hypothetical protein
MASNLDSILGLKLYDGEDSCIYENGIAYKKNFVVGPKGIRYLLWENVDEMYVSASVLKINYVIPGGEYRTIVFCDSSGRGVGFSMSGWFKMKQEKKDIFNDIYLQVLDKISPRLWQQFLENIRQGKRISFNKFEMTRDALYFRKLFKGYSDKLDISRIKAQGIDKGYFYIQYQGIDNKIYIKSIGPFDEIPNMHIIQTYLNSFIKEKN